MTDFSSPISILKRYQTTLKNTSKELNAGVCMTESTYPAINFDNVKRKFKKPKFCCFRSNDALLLPPEGNDKYVFVEFKDGNIESPNNITEIAEKIYESLFLFNEIMNQNISFDKSHMVYILVFNEKDNGRFAQDAHLAKNAGKKYVVPELNRYRNLFFDFSTMTKSEFSYLTNKLDRGLYPF